MKLGLRIFFCYLIIFIVCFSYPVGWVLDTLRIRYLEGVEDPLVDQANILAELVGEQMAPGRFDSEGFNKTLNRVYDRKLNSRIYSLTKNSVDIQIYITDTNGKVIFHSINNGEVGKSYAHRRDVALTLEGSYGARTTLADPQDSTSSVLFVAAPIMINGVAAGVLTVGKPTTNINSFIKAAKPKILTVVAAAGAAAIVLSYLTALWIARPIKRLTRYADAIRSGERTVFPTLDSTEIGDLGRALKRMQERLEGKAYVEQYVQKLTHELKSPLSAIRGAAELLEEAVPADRKRRFLANIRTEAGRIQAIVDRMLELAALEFKKQLNHRKKVNLDTLAKTVLESKQPMIVSKQLVVTTKIDPVLTVRGDPFLLHQAVANLVQNAIDFCNAGGCIGITAGTYDRSAWLMVEDNGASIPPYAIEKIFDKFYSLKRPDSGTKSTGLGLNLVREVAQLHDGRIELQNISPKGVRATLTIRRCPPFASLHRIK